MHPQLLTWTLTSRAASVLVGEGTEAEGVVEVEVVVVVGAVVGVGLMVVQEVVGVTVGVGEVDLEQSAKVEVVVKVATGQVKTAEQQLEVKPKLSMRMHLSHSSL